MYCILCSKDIVESCVKIGEGDVCDCCFRSYSAFINDGGASKLLSYPCSTCLKRVLHGFGEWSNPPKSIMTLKDLEDRSGWGEHFCVNCFE